MPRHCTTIDVFPRFPGHPLVRRPARLPIVTKHHHRREVFIQGITSDGRTFRPSDWAERLAGTMSVFRPRGSVPANLGGAISYSPYCVPRVIAGVKCVIVNEALREIEPMAWDFVMNFARDNDLQVIDACLLPETELLHRPAAKPVVHGGPAHTRHAPAAHGVHAAPGHRHDPGHGHKQAHSHDRGHKHGTSKAH